jgi:hypothetical protein
MNIHYAARKTLSSLAKIAPPALHLQILKQYLHDRDLALQHGILCLKQNYSSPVTVASEIDTSLLGKKRILPGIHFDKERIARLGNHLAVHAGEFPWRSGAGDKPEVPWGDMFPTLDSLVLYAMVRQFKPQNYIEVGCGYSSRVSSAAARKNHEDGVNTLVKYIEPYPGERLEEANLCGDLVVKKIQEVPLEMFSALGPGDMLFIDTSHIMKCQSDVEWELLHILPSLKSGVIIHIHDVYTPYEQPPAWLDNNYAPGFYNEQYAFEALLSGGGRFQPLFPIHFVCREMPEKLVEWFRVSADSSRSFWFIVD